MLCAALPTASMVRAANRNGSMPPMNRPISVVGLVMERFSAKSGSSVCTLSI